MSSDSRDNEKSNAVRHQRDSARASDDVCTDEEQDMSVDELKRKISNGEYRVNSRRLAALMLSHPEQPMEPPREEGEPA